MGGVGQQPRDPSSLLGIPEAGLAFVSVCRVFVWEVGSCTMQQNVVGQRGEVLTSTGQSPKRHTNRRFQKTKRRLLITRNSPKRQRSGRNQENSAAMFPCVPPPRPILNCMREGRKIWGSLSPLPGIPGNIFFSSHNMDCDSDMKCPSERLMY